MIWVAALFWSLLHSLWQGLVLHACGAVVLSRVRSVSQRYLLLVALQLVMAVAFVATLGHELGMARAAQLSFASVPLARVGSPPSWLNGSMFVLVAGWASGLAWMTLRLGRGFRGLRRLSSHAMPLEAWLSVVERHAARLGIRRVVGIAEGPGLDSPLAFGWLRPVIMMPLGWAAQLEPQVVEAAILHELVHLRRHDFVINVAQHVVEAIFFFHPSVWWLSKQVRAQRELCCDQVVADSHLDPLDYAAALLALERQRKSALRPALGSGLSLAASRGDLSARVEQVLGRRSEEARSDEQRGLGAGIAALVLGVAATLGACLDAGSIDEGNAASALEEPAASTAQASVAPVLHEPAASRPSWLPESVARFGAAIESAAAAHHVDPALLSVMVLVESRGNPDAVSPRGALGLMQVMPATAALIAGERGLPAPTREQLVDPVYNLDFGAYYVAQQLASFADRPEPERVKLAAMAYNGGPRALGNYLAGVAQLYRETMLYSELVTRLWQDRNAEASATYQTLP